MIPLYLTPMRDCRMMALKCLSLCLILFRVRNLTRDYHVITMVTIQVSSTQVGGLGLRLLYFHIGLTRTITIWVLKHLSLTLHNYPVKQQVLSMHRETMNSFVGACRHAVLL